MTLHCVDTWQRKREREGEMEAVTVFGGVSSSSSSSSSLLARSSPKLTSNYKPISFSSLKPHLSAFPSHSLLFSHFSSLSNVKTLTRKSSTKPGIFLPHLIASLVLFPFILSPFTLSKTFLSLVFNIWNHSLQEQVEESYIMVKPDGVQRGFVSPIFVWILHLWNFVFFFWSLWLMLELKVLSLMWCFL